MADTPATPTANTKTSTPTLQVGKTYKIKESAPTAWWWKRKHDGLPEVQIEGTIDKVLGMTPEQMSKGHPMVEAVKDRSLNIKDWNELHVATVRGRSELVHPDELEGPVEPKGS